MITKEERKKMLRLSERQIKNLKNDGVDIKRIESFAKQIIEILKSGRVSLKECEVIIGQLNSEVQERYLAARDTLF